MADIVLISKYPPLEGGIAAKTYWLARALACAGHTIHIVTDALNIDTVHSIPEADHLPDTPGVIVHRADQDVPWHIPNDKHRAISLLDKILEVISQNNPELIIGGYLIPYGIAAFQASQITGIPFVLLHGGTDINKFLLKNVWPNIIQKALGAARLIITDADNHAHIKRFTDRIKILPPYVPDPSAFKPAERQKKESVMLALIGKANYHWHHKGWQQVINLWSALGEEFKFVVVSQGIGLDDFRSSVPKELRDRIIWQSFVPPWEMPTLLHTFDGIFHLQNHFPFPMFSNLVLESLTCGTPVITDSFDAISSYRKHDIDLGNAAANILPLTFFDPTTDIADMLNHLSKQEDNIAWDCAPAFNQYLSSFQSILLDAINEN